MGRKNTTGTYIDDKGYLRISAGPMRGIRVHTLVAQAKLGRPLLKDEVVHHIDGDKSNPHPDNLEVLNENVHNAVSSRQYWRLKRIQDQEEREWAEFLNQQIPKPVPEDELPIM